MSGRWDLESFLELSPYRLVIADFSGRLVEASPAWAAWLGHSCERLRGTPFLDPIHPEDRARTEQAVARLISNDGPLIGFINPWRGADGGYRFLSWNARSVPDQRLIYAVARDVTELETARSELARVRDDLACLAADRSAKVAEQERIIDQLRDSVVTADLAARITGWNRGAERLFGYTAEEMLGEHVERLYPEDERAFLRDRVIAPVKAKGEHLAEAIEALEQPPGRGLFEHRCGTREGWRWVQWEATFGDHREAAARLQGFRLRL